MATWPFRRTRDAAPSPGPAPAPADGAAGAVEPPGWASLPALSGSFGSPSPTFKTGATVTEDLVAWRSPRLSGAMSHAVSPDGPSGHVAGLLTPVPGAPAGTGSAVPAATGSASGTGAAGSPAPTGPATASAGAGSAAGQRRADVDLVLATPPGDSDLPGPIAPRVLPADTTFSAPARPVEAPAPTMLLRRLPVVPDDAGPTAPTGDHDLAPPGPAVPAADLPVQRAPEATADPAGSSSPRPEITADMADLAIFQRPRRDRPADTPSVQRLPDAAAGLELPVARPSTAGDSSTGDAPATTPGESPSSAGTTGAPLVAPRGLLPGGEQPSSPGPTAASTHGLGSGAAAAPVVHRRPDLVGPPVQRRNDDLVDGTGAIPVPSALPLGTGPTRPGDFSGLASPTIDPNASLRRKPLAGLQHPPGSASLPRHAPTQGEILGGPGSTRPQGTRQGLGGDGPPPSTSLGRDPLAGAGPAPPLGTPRQRELLAGDRPASTMALNASGHGGLSAGTPGSTLPLSPLQRGLLAGDGPASALLLNAPGQGGLSAGDPSSTLPPSASPHSDILAGHGPASTLALNAPGLGGPLAGGPGSAPLRQRDILAGNPASSLPLTSSRQRRLLGGDDPASTLPSSASRQPRDPVATRAPGHSTSAAAALPRGAPGPGDGLATLPLQRDLAAGGSGTMPLQQSAGPAATTVDTAPGLTYTTTLQRTEDAAAPPPPQEPVRDVTFPAPPPAEAPAPAPVPEAPAAEPATATPADLDDLAHKLYDRIRWRLRAELRRDMERAGLGAGVRR